VRVKSFLTALVVFWAVPVLAQGTGGPQAQPSGELPQKETQVAQAQPPPATPPPPAPPPPSAPPPAPFTFAFRGFVSGSVFVQDGITGGAAGLSVFNGNVPLAAGGNTGQGQGAFLGVAELPADKLIYGGDVRQTRLNFSMKGPPVLGGATPTGVIELDFFGGFTGGAFLDESVMPRLRLAYIDAVWPETTLRVGQFHNLLLGFIPASAAHIANPYVTGALLGWRSPGVTLLQRVPVGGMSLELGLQVNRNTWTDNVPACSQTVTSGCVPRGISTAEASGWPQVQARVSLTSGKTPSPWPLYPLGDFLVFVAGEWDQKDVTGVGVVGGDAFTTYAVQGGAKVNAGPLMLAASGWLGQNTGNMLGNIAQFPPFGSDVFGMGGWVQAGLSLTKEWSVWGLAGTDRPDQEDISEAITVAPTLITRRFQNVYSGMLAYKDGPYAVGLEWVHWTTKLQGGEPVDVNQGIATVTYFF
jgi:hypothetical protein